MNHSVDPLPHQRTEPLARPRPRIAWVLIALFGGLVATSFLVRWGEAEAPARSATHRAKPVAAAPVVRGAITERGQYPGELDANAADVGAFYAGRLVSLEVRVGDTVEKGEILAELDPVDAKEQIVQARAQARAAAAEHQRATVERDGADQELSRLEPLARDRLLSPLELDRQRAKAQALAASVERAEASEAEALARIQLLQKRIAESQVRAPFTGRIAARYLDPGVIVSAGERLVRIVALTPLRVRFEVPESDVSRLAVGTHLSVITQATGETRGVARVTGIGSEVNRERRVVRVEGLVEESPSSWLPGMYAEVHAELRTIEKATIVPSPAVLSRLAQSGKLATGVFVVQGDKARWIPVSVVAREGERVAVSGDLAPPSQVLTLGHVDLRDDTLIELTNASKARIGQQ